jgi:hypothetical protein
MGGRNRLMKYSVFLIFLFIFNSSVGQVTAAVTKTDVQDGDFLLGLQFGLPGEQMKKAVHNKMADIGFGGTIYYLTNPLTWGKKKRNSPIRLGGELAYTYYGRFISDVNIGGYQGSYKTSYGILNLNAIFRLRPPKVAPVVPFADLIVGGNFYISRTKENLDALESALGVETTDFGGYSSSSFNKGIGAGLSFGSAKAREARFVLRVTCNWGSDIKYVVRNSVTYDPGNNKLNYEIGKAPVKYFLIQLGVGL